jgi:hypothetical protein
MHVSPKTKGTRCRKSPGDLLGPKVRTAAVGVVVEVQLKTIE